MGQSSLRRCDTFGSWRMQPLIDLQYVFFRKEEGMLGCSELIYSTVSCRGWTPDPIQGQTVVSQIFSLSTLTMEPFFSFEDFGRCCKKRKHIPVLFSFFFFRLLKPKGSVRIFNILLEIIIHNSFFLPFFAAFIFPPGIQQKVWNLLIICWIFFFLEHMKHKNFCI